MLNQKMAEVDSERASELDKLRTDFQSQAKISESKLLDTQNSTFSDLHATIDTLSREVTEKSQIISELTAS